MRTTPHLMLEPAFHPGLDTAGSGRDAIGLGAATSGRLDARHGTILSLEDINVSFDGFKALRDLTLYIGVGELRCIIGPNGAGKTTLMDVITGKTRPQSGTAYFGDTLDLTRMSEVQIAQAGIGRKFQAHGVRGPERVREPRTGAEGRQVGGPACARGSTARRGNASRRCSPPSACWSRGSVRRVCCPTARSSSSRSACCWCRNRSCCCSTSRWRA